MRKYLLAILILSVVACWGQQQSLSLPELMTPSPKATMMNRFGNYPTNLYTGLVDITIPIHTIQVGGYTLPIEFKYHASGLKYDDLPMEVGYGWTLIAGGTVSYNARGARAFGEIGENKESFIKKVEDIQKNNSTSMYGDQRQLIYVMNGYETWLLQSTGKYRDSEYDEYTFSFPGNSGQFYLLDNTNSPWSSFSAPAALTTRLNGNYFTPTASDEHGNHYKFDIRDEDISIDRNYTYYLTQVNVAGTKEAINFTYQQINAGASSDKLVMRPIINTTYNITQNTGISSDITKSLGGSFDIFHKKFNTPILKEITYKGGKVEFIYSTTSIRSIEKIRIYEHNRLTKTIVLEKRENAYLDAVHFKEGDGSQNQPVYSYRMAYNGTKPKDGWYATIDYWGYYNSAGRTIPIPAGDRPGAGYVPNFNLSSFKIPGMNRAANETHMQQGILTKIIYPTKGYTIFSYEAHRHQGVLYGGLRIKEIKNYDASGSLLEKKWYEYNNARAIRPVSSRDYHLLSYSIEAVCIEDRYGNIYGPGVGYNHFYTYTYGAFPRCSYFLQGSAVVYPVVTEYTGISTTPESTTEYRFTDFMNEYINVTIRNNPADIPKWDNSWKCGKLLSKIIRDRAEKTVYFLSNEYAEINRKDLLNLRVHPYISIHGPCSHYINEENFSTYPAFADKMSGSFYDYYNYYITSGEYKVSKSQENINGANVKTTYYKYNFRGQVIEEKLVNSDGSELITKNKHVTDYWDYENENSPNELMNNMYSRNMLSSLLEKSIYKGSTLVDKVTREYKEWYGIIAPQYIKQLNYYEPRIKYGSYDGYGNPTAISKDDLEQTYYLWGHQGSRLIAKMEGGSFTALGTELINRVTSAAYPSTADMQAIEALRNNATLQNARLTTLYYDTNTRRLTSVIAPNGTKTGYTYDSYGRLVSIKDHNGMILETYQYDYKQ